MQIALNPVFKKINKSKQRYRVFLGGYGSGKSVDVALQYIAKLSDPKLKGANLLVVRATEKSHKQSTYAQLVQAINALGLSKHFECNVSPLRIKSLITGNEIAFRGCNDVDARERLKSFTFDKGNLTWVWIEEASEITQDDFNLINGRLRGQLENPNLFYQITMTLNPTRKNHWIRTELWDNPNAKNVIKCHSTYKDNRFLDEAYLEMIKQVQETNLERYNLEYEGMWGSLEGLILTNWNTVHAEQDLDFYDEVKYGLDFGFNHKNALLLVGFKDGELYIIREHVTRGKNTNEIIDEVEKRGCFPKSIHGTADSASPEQIKTWTNKGYRFNGSIKGKGSVLNHIDYLKGIRIHVDADCTYTIEELEAWSWTRDKQTNEWLDIPCEGVVGDDCMASLRYAIEEKARYTKKNKLKSFNKSLLGI